MPEWGMSASERARLSDALAFGTLHSIVPLRQAASPPRAPYSRTRNLDGREVFVGLDERKRLIVDPALDQLTGRELHWLRTYAEPELRRERARARLAAKGLDRRGRPLSPKPKRIADETPDERMRRHYRQAANLQLLAEQEGWLDGPPGPERGVNTSVNMTHTAERHSISGEEVDSQS